MGSCLMLAKAIAVVVSLLYVSSLWAQKEALIQSIDGRGEQTWRAAKQIWEWAEPGYQEKRSAQLLSKMLKSAGFTIQSGVAGIPTAFTATIGQGKPVIGILGEYDALPGLSQEAVPFRRVRQGATYGHGCGHHLFGVASASACMALAEQIRGGKIKGTLRYYGCPAEEGGAAKVFMVRAGLFDDCDVVLHWHPGSRNSAGSRSCLARMAVKFRFHGKSAHAAGSPEKGRSALDAVELTNHAAQLLREHCPDFTRIHHVITDGGGAPNVVPDFAEVYYYIRHPEADILKQLYPRLVKCAQGAAIATETKLETVYLGGTMPLLPNNTISEVIHRNLAKWNDLKYDDEERQFAIRIQNTLTSPPPLDSIAKVDFVSGGFGKGSTDVGDVSWVVPTAGFSTACWVPGTPAHSWQAVAAGGTTIARKGMQLAAKVLATSAYDLFLDAKTIENAKAEHRRRVGGNRYQPLLEKDQKPPLDYRDPPRR
ncbi:MAG: glutamate carboxypeptidase [Gemmatales bacterium]|nr:MAG: glutamate carboxypeptidase [Gemmatales bacterium]